MTRPQESRANRSKLMAPATLAAFLADTAGSTLTTVALALPILIGASGLGVEVSSWYAARRQMQTAADAAALSGAYELARRDHDQIEPAALQEAGRNGYGEGGPTGVTVSRPPTGGAFAGKGSAVEVLITSSEDLLLSGVLLDGAVEIVARGVAMVETTGSACVLALDPTASSAINNQGNVTVHMPGCVLAANSTDPSAISISGNTTFDADSLWTAGNYTHDGSATVTMERPPITEAWALDDPYADLDPWVPGGCDASNASYSNTTVTISPGKYCGGLSVGANATVTMEPGTYYLNAGDFEVHAQGTVDCACDDPGEGVTIVLTTTGAISSIGGVNINAGADIDLQAPSDPTADYPGVLFFQDARADPNETSFFNGGADMHLSGAIYFPSQLLTWSGTSDMSAPTCTVVVGRRVTFIGNAVIDNSTCEEAGVEPITISAVVLVE
ncbi:MAG: pilus assembly protein TadG-related protein [Kiloniellales bacterium]